MDDLDYIVHCIQVLRSRVEYTQLHDELVSKLKELNQKVWYRDAKTTSALQRELCQKVLNKLANERGVIPFCL